MAFTTQLFYFTMKALFCYILCRYRTPLNESAPSVVLYALMLLANAYLILTTGRNPGYQQPGP